MTPTPESLRLSADAIEAHKCPPLERYLASCERARQAIANAKK